MGLLKCAALLFAPPVKEVNPSGRAGIALPGFFLIRFFPDRVDINFQDARD